MKEATIFGTIFMFTVAHKLLLNLIWKFYEKK